MNESERALRIAQLEEEIARRQGRIKALGKDLDASKAPALVPEAKPVVEEILPKARTPRKRRGPLVPLSTTPIYVLCDCLPEYEQNTEAFEAQVTPQIINADWDSMLRGGDSSPAASPEASQAVLVSTPRNVIVDWSTTKAAAYKEMQKDDFQNFLYRSTHIMERVIFSDDLDILTERDGDDDLYQIKRRNVAKMEEQAVYKDKVWSKEKACTSIDINHSGISTFLGTFFTSSSEADDQTQKIGCALEFNLEIPDKAVQQYYVSGSTISCSRYLPQSPNCVIGATFNGQVVIFDSRTGSDPTDRSAVGDNLHTSPIFNIYYRGTDAWTVGSDGRIVTWNVRKLGQPKEVFDVCVEVPNGLDDLSIACSSLSDGGIICMGGHDGSVSTIACGQERHHPRPARVVPIVDEPMMARMPVLRANRITDSHAGPVHSIHYHPRTENTLFEACTDLVLTSSADWSVALWNAQSRKGFRIKTFTEFKDTVYSCRWSPTNGILFAAGDGNGTLTLWNVLQTRETPLYELDVSHGAACSAIEWLPNGRSLLAADTRGEVRSVGVSEDLQSATDEDMEQLLSLCISME